MPSILHNVRSRLAKAISPINPLPSAPKPDGAIRDYQGYNRDFYGTPLGRADAAEASITVNRCIDFRVNQIRNVEWSIYNTQDKPIQNHAFHKMLEWHHQQYRQSFFDRWLKMLLIHGNVYMEKLYREDNGLPGGLRILNSLYVEPNIEDDNLVSFSYSHNHTKISDNLDIQPGMVLWDIIPSAHSDWRGKSPLDRAIEAVNIDRYNLQTIKSYLLNDNKPATILTLDPNAPHYDNNQLEELLENWKKQGEGASGGYGTRILLGPFQVFPFSTQKPDMIYSYEMSSLICREFKIDPSLVGVQDQTDGSNTQKFSQMETKFINALTDAVKPDMHHLEDFINYHILPFLAPNNRGYKFRWHYDEIDRMIRYSDKSVDQLRSDFLAGIITKDELREARFWNKMREEAGNTFQIPKGYVHVAEDDMGDLSLIRELDTEQMQTLIEGAPSPAVAASGSPDFGQVNAMSEERPGENRYPVAEDPSV